MRLIGNHGEAFTTRRCQFPHGLDRKRKRLNRADDNLLIAGQRFGKFGTLAADIAFNPRHDAGCAFEAKDRLPQLTVDHIAVRDYQDGIEDFLVVGIMQIREEVRRPCNRICLTRPGGMLNQILMTRTFRQDRGLKFARHIQLMVTREDDGLQVLLVVTFSHQVPPKDFQPTVTRPDLFPQVRRRMAVRIQRIACCAVVAEVERQETCPGTVQPGRHANFTVADGKVNQCTIWKGQQRFRVLTFGRRVPVESVLVHCIVDALREISFQFYRRDGNAVQEQHKIDAVLIVQRIPHLSDDSQRIRGIA